MPSRNAVASTCAVTGSRRAYRCLRGLCSATIAESVLSFTTVIVSRLRLALAPALTLIVVPFFVVSCPGRFSTSTLTWSANVVARNAAARAGIRRPWARGRRRGVRRGGANGFERLEPLPTDNSELKADVWRSIDHQTSVNSGQWSEVSGLRRSPTFPRGAAGQARGSRGRAPAPQLLPTAQHHWRCLLHVSLGSPSPKRVSWRPPGQSIRRARRRHMSDTWAKRGARRLAGSRRRMGIR